jgi:hypothetical protein
MHSDGAGAGVSGRSMTSLRVIRGGRGGAPDVGPIGDISAAFSVAASYKDVAQKYANMAGGLAKDLIDDANKAIAVYEAVGEGAAIGGMVGPWGAAAGAVIAGIYSTFDNFGGDIEKAMHDTFNPDDFTPGQYDEMKRNCVRSGGIPNWGHAPDNEDGCIYPDGTTSGGDYARHPPPGQQSIRGDSFYDYNLTRSTCPGPFGVPIPLPAGTKCLPGIGPVPTPAPPKKKPIYSQLVQAKPMAPIGPALLAKANVGSTSVADLRSVEKRIEMLHALKPGETLAVGAQIPFLSAADQAQLASEGKYAPGKGPAAVVPLTPADIIAKQDAAAAVRAAPTDAPTSNVVPIVVAGAGALTLAAGLFFVVKRLL